MRRLNELALFAGIGGGILAGKLLGWHTVCAVEKEPYAQAILMARQVDKALDFFPIWDDIKSFDGTPWCGIVDIVSAGFPCQPWSPAGKRLGEADDRNLWPDTIRVIREVKPRFVVLENSSRLPGNPYFVQIIKDLEDSGYCPKVPTIIAASDVGAPHQRKRMWFCSIRDVAKQGLQTGTERRISEAEEKVNSKLDSKSKRSSSSWWEHEPGVGRMVDGLPFTMDRIKALGNAQVPRVAAIAWKILGIK